MSAGSQQDEVFNMLRCVRPCLEARTREFRRHVLVFMTRKMHAELQRPHPRPEFAGLALRSLVEGVYGYMCASLRV